MDVVSVEYVVVDDAYDKVGGMDDGVVVSIPGRVNGLGEGHCEPGLVP